MTKYYLLMFLAPALVIAGVPPTQQSAESHPMHEKHESDRQAGVNQRGDKAMGFDQAKTTHHFLLSPDGGVIQVETNGSKDTASRDQIRMHLRHIAQAFSEGNFEIPMFVHEQVPPGVPTMKRLQKEISYKFETTERGATVRISTHNPEAAAAVQDFLRFQIKDHHTGDSLEVQKAGRS